jgi:hypothetical protein
MQWSHHLCIHKMNLKAIEDVVNPKALTLIKIRSVDVNGEDWRFTIRDCNLEMALKEH